MHCIHIFRPDIEHIQVNDQIMCFDILDILSSMAPIPWPPSSHFHVLHPGCTEPCALICVSWTLPHPHGPAPSFILTTSPLPSFKGIAPCCPHHAHSSMSPPPCPTWSCDHVHITFMCHWVAHTQRGGMGDCKYTVDTLYEHDIKNSELSEAQVE